MILNEIWVKIHSYNKTWIAIILLLFSCQFILLGYLAVQNMKNESHYIVGKDERV
jgi:hypothetical protein